MTTTDPFSEMLQSDVHMEFIDRNELSDLFGTDFTLKIDEMTVVKQENDQKQISPPKIEEILGREWK